jgi:hypothetical protein
MSLRGFQDRCESRWPAGTMLTLIAMVLFGGGFLRSPEVTCSISGLIQHLGAAGVPNGTVIAKSGFLVPRQSKAALVRYLALH